MGVIVKGKSVGGGLFYRGCARSQHRQCAAGCLSGNDSGVVGNLGLDAVLVVSPSAAHPTCSCFPITTA